MDKASKLLLPIRYDFVQVVGSLIQKLCKIFPTCYTYKGMLKPTTLNFRFISNLHHLSDTTCLTDTNENGLSIASLLFSFSKLLKPVNYFPSFCISWEPRKSDWKKFVLNAIYFHYLNAKRWIKLKNINDCKIIVKQFLKS